MSNPHRCAKCDGHKLFLVPEVVIDTVERAVTFAAHLTMPSGRTGAQAFLHGAQDRVDVPFAALVCAACGYTEWYASRDKLAKLADVAARSDAVRVIEDPEPSPYR